MCCKKIIAILVVLFSVSCLFVAVSWQGEVLAADVIEWRVTATAGTGHPQFELLKDFANSVEKASGGRLKISLYPGGSLYPVNQSLDAVKKGVTEGTVTWGDYWSGKEPMLQLLSYRPCDPFENYDEYNYLLMKTEPLMREAYKKLGVTYITDLIAIPGEIFQSRKPIRSLSDFKGLRVRSSGLGQTLYSKLGAAITAISKSELYSSLQLGSLDAFEAGSPADNWQGAYYEVTKYIIEPALHCRAVIGGNLIVNNDAWNSLPDDLKNIVYECGRAYRADVESKLKVLDKEAMKKYAEYGIKIIRLSDEDIAEAQKIAVDVLNEFKSKSPLATEYIETYYNVLIDLGYIEEAKQLK